MPLFKIYSFQVSFFQIYQQINLFQFSKTNTKHEMLLYISLICKENNVKTESTFITSFQTSKPQSPIKQLCHTFRIALQMVKTVPEK